MTPTSLYRMGLVEAAQAIRRGDLSSEDLTRALLERIAGHEQTVQAFQWIDPASALDLARQADRRLRSGEALGPLHGIPIGIKDIIETQGIPTAMGSPIFDGHVPARSAALVRRAEAAGAFVLGKTVTTEFAFFSPGKTRNPWNPAHTPGGSSSGSAAAVAMGFLPGAVGTQTNGSVIRPGRLLRGRGVQADSGPHLPLRRPPLQPQPRSAGRVRPQRADAALLAAVLAGKAGAESSGNGPSRRGLIPGEAGPPWTALRGWPPCAPRSGTWPIRPPSALSGDWRRGCEPPERRSKNRSCRRRSKMPTPCTRTIMYGEGARVFAELQRRERGRLSPRLNALIDEGLGHCGLRTWPGGWRKRSSSAGELDAFLAAFDGAHHPAHPRGSARGPDADRGPRLLHHLVAVRCARRHHPDGTRSGRPAARSAGRGSAIIRRSGSLGCPLVRRASRVESEDRRIKVRSVD